MNSSKQLIRHYSGARRRGVILLLVLGLMTMFALLVLTFMVVTSQSWRMSDSHQKYDAVVDHRSKSVGESDAWSGLLELLRGSTRTSIGMHSILENLYGHPVDGSGDLLEFEITNANYVSNLSGSYAPELTVNANGNTSLVGTQLIGLDLRLKNSNVTASNIYDLMGNVLMVSDNSSINGVTRSPVRIVKKTITDNVIYITIYTPEVVTPNDLNGKTCFVNSAPYSGTGIGFNVNAGLSAPKLTLRDSDGVSLLLRPNVMAPNNTGAYDDHKTWVENNLARMNVDYTAPDANNMFLCWIDWSSSNTSIIPSFLRPSLMRYLRNNHWPTDQEAQKDLVRKVVLRPMPFDHPDFTGSNRSWDFTNSGTLADMVNLCAGGASTYDVDNDGDGIREGIWIDVGHPVRRSSDGRLYKTLVSVTVLDMDGRMNVNVHGNAQQTSTYAPSTSGVPWLEAGWNSSTLLCGSGTGPAGVNLVRGLGALVGNSDANNAALRLMSGITGGGSYMRSGRYGLQIGPGWDWSENNFYTSDKTLFDCFFTYYPYDGNNIITGVRTNIGGAPPDLWDMNVVAFDALGHKFRFPYANDGTAWKANILTETPYIFDPYHVSPAYDDAIADQRFTPAELADLLRATDVDYNSLPKRLQQVLAGTNGSVDLYGSGSASTLVREGAKYLTTMSSDIPLPNRRMGQYEGIYALLYHCIEDQMIRKGVAEGKIDLADYNTRDALSADLSSHVMLIVEDLMKILPEEIRNGEKLDLNKLSQRPTWNAVPYGANGYDFNTHLLGLQEKSDYARGIYLLLMAMSYDQLYGVDEVFHNGSQLVFSSDQPNHELARVRAPYFEPAFEQEDRLVGDGDLPKELRRQVMATRLAQYAVNLVDYADPDATMTPLVFDINPFAIAFLGSNDLPDRTDSGWLQLTNSGYNPSVRYKGESAIGFSNTFYSYYNGVPASDLHGFLTDTTHKGFPAGLNMCRARVVYGMERSDLLLTETLATHDLGVADTSSDDCPRDDDKATPAASDTIDASKLDPHFDQVKMPQASAWFELYCAADPYQASQPQDLFDFDSSVGKWRLDLGRQAPNQVNGLGVANLRYPVWHLAISESTNPLNVTSSDGDQKNNIALRLADKEKQPITFSLQTQQPEYTSWTQGAKFYSSILGPTDNTSTNVEDDVVIDRIVWFSFLYPLEYVDSSGNVLYGTFPNCDKIFWGRGSGNDMSGSYYSGTNAEPSQLYPNEYLVVAPRMTTYLGSLAQQTPIVGDDGETILNFGVPSGEGVDLKNNADEGGNPLFKGIRMPRVLVAAAQVPKNWGDIGVESGDDYEHLNKIANLGVGTSNNLNQQNLGIGVNISAPMPNLRDGNGFITNPNYYEKPKGTRENESRCTPAQPENEAYSDYQNYYNGINYYEIYSRKATDETSAMDQGKGAYRGTGKYQITSTAYKNDDGKTVFPDVPYDLKNGCPIAEDSLYGEGTIPMYRSVVLQRLSDPNLPYHPMMNPYITVDWSMMDLSVFTGEDEMYNGSGDNAVAKETFLGDETNKSKAFAYLNQDGGPQTEKTGEGEKKKEVKITVLDKSHGDIANSPDNKNELDLRFRLASRQWGRTAMPSALQDKKHTNPWSRVMDVDWMINSDTATNTDTIVSSLALDPSLIKNSSSLKNDEMLWPNGLGTWGDLNVPHRPQHSLGQINWMHSTNGVNKAIKILDVNDTKENLTGVPAIPQSVYLNDIDKIIVPSPNNDGDEWYYGAPSNNSAYVPFVNHAWNNSPYSNPYEVMSVPASSPGRFGLEFVDREQSMIGDTSYGSLGSGGRFGFPTTESDASTTPGLGYVLNFFHSSLDTEESMNLGGFLDHIQVPSRFRGTKLWLDTRNVDNTTNINVRPFAISTYREPGRVNVNTTLRPTWEAVRNDRELPNRNGTDYYQQMYNSRNHNTSNTLPMDIVYPFRSQSMSTVVPDSSMTTEPAYAALLRNSGSSNSVDPLLTPNNLTNNTYVKPYAEELEGLQRLSSMTTTRSNVFAVWITVGYFEAEPFEFDTDQNVRTKQQMIYPDGCRFGEELGYSTGDVMRHRSFYLIDRTIPVGFRRGENLNATDTVILKTAVE